MLQTYFDAMSADMRQKLTGYSFTLLSPHQKAAVVHRVQAQRATVDFQESHVHAEARKDSYEEQREKVREQRKQRLMVRHLQ